MKFSSKLFNLLVNLSLILIGFLKSKLLIFLSKWLENKIYNQSDKIIALSDGINEEILKIIKDKNKIHTITNLCDLEKFSINKNVLDKNH